jgi:hypothetical protein
MATLTGFETTFEFSQIRAIPAETCGNQRVKCARLKSRVCTNRAELRSSTVRLCPTCRDLTRPRWRVVLGLHLPSFTAALNKRLVLAPKVPSAEQGPVTQALEIALSILSLIGSEAICGSCSSGSFHAPIFASLTALGHGADCRLRLLTPA